MSQQANIEELRTMLYEVSTNIRLLTQAVHRVEANQAVMRESLLHDGQRLTAIEQRIQAMRFKTGERPRVGTDEGGYGVVNG